jgi:predicted nucleotidyltransferase
MIKTGRVRNVESYIATAHRREKERKAQLSRQRLEALKLARQAAQILREDFGVSRVTVFGSVLKERDFHETSDLDLAVWDLPPADYFKAVARLMALSDLSIDLVEAETASFYVLDGIALGMEL